MSELIALLNGREIGRVTRNNRGRLAFGYAEEWRAARGAYPLSLSMPLAAVEHGHRPVEAFLWGLLPDNDTILERWARRFQVSARNPFALISHVGEDCAGAAQFVRPDRLDAVLGQGPVEIEWLDERSIAERLRILRADHAAWRIPHDTGQFSLAGAQPKTALLYENGSWGIPSGRTPTTHILKPPTGEFDGHAENEHLCMRLASALGLITARSEVKWFEDEVAIVIERTIAKEWTLALSACTRRIPVKPSRFFRRANTRATVGQGRAQLSSFLEPSPVGRMMMSKGLSMRWPSTG